MITFLAFRSFLVLQDDPGSTYELYLIGVYIVKTILTKFSKFVSLMVLPDWLTARPECDRCSVLGDRSRGGGFPSGHAWTVATMYCMFIFSMNGDLVRIASSRGFYLMTVLTGGVVWSRWALGCHTPVQLAAGVSLGILTSPGAWSMNSAGRSQFWEMLW